MAVGLLLTGQCLLVLAGLTEFFQEPYFVHHWTILNCPKHALGKPTETQSRETGRSTIHGNRPKHNPRRLAETQSRETLSFHCYRGSHCMSIDTVLIHWISLGHCCFHTEHSVFNATVNFNAVIVTYYYTLFAAVMSNSRAVFTLHVQPRAKEE
jgi:hypothetical protein